MEEDVRIEFIPREQQNSSYDWANIITGSERAGKARCKIKDDTLIIYSINVYQDFEGRGFGRQFVEEAKENFSKIVADRVRQTAIGFWEKLGFVPDKRRTNWIWTKSP
ncbi:MAG: GNAT family N-acetyltransferase [Candidatus Kapaibacterium sp.]